jgi:Rieske Fe-S protein
MILVLDPHASPGLVDDVVRRAEALGWRCEVSRGEEQIVVALSGSGDPAELDAALADRADVDVVPILSHNEYRRLRLRRRLMTGIAGALGLMTAVGAGVPVIGFLLPPKGVLGDREFVRVAAKDELRRRPSKVVTLFGQPVVLVRRDGERYFALSAICTHMSVCILDWNEERGQLVCPCHGGAFDVYGNVVQGPPSVPLRAYPVEAIGDDLYVRREG